MRLVPASLRKWGFTNVSLVEEQAVIDGNFPTVESPNPEERKTMAKAIELLPSDSEYREPAKTSMNAFRSRFPTSEECFFNELQEGARYTVNCGTAAGVSTTVRPR